MTSALGLRRFLPCILWMMCPSVAAARPTIAVPPGASGQSPVLDGGAPVTVKLVANVGQVNAGDSFEAGVYFELAPGWHIYWINPGDAGFATELHWQVGDAQMAQPLWPAPQVFRESDGITTYGYQDEVLIPVPASVSDSVSDGLELNVEVRYLACNVICSPGQVHLRRHLPVGQEAVPSDVATTELFAAAHKEVPIPLSRSGVEAVAKFSQDKVRPGDNFRVAVLLSPCDTAQGNTGRCAPLGAPGEPFAPLPDAGITWRVVQTRAHPTRRDGLALVLCAQAASDAQALPDALRGVLRLSRGGALLPPVQVDIALPKAPRDAQIVPQQDSLFADAPLPATKTDEMPKPRRVRKIFEALALALLGGIVLNAMPCVLPVLAIKVMGITQMGQRSRRDIALYGLSYSAGIVVSMLVLCGTVLGLKAVGTQVGWGFQFQEPYFVAGLSTVLVVFALNCFGVFEIYTGAGALGRVAAQAHGGQRSFLDGVLAVVLATPCSAPFLGSAVAYALTSAWYATVCVFLAIGIGLAAPFVLLTLVPGLVRVLPKPGAWMTRLKQSLGFGLLATVVWLVWLIGRVAGVDGAAQLLLFLLGVALCTWIYGILVDRWPARQASLALALAAVVIGGGAKGLSLHPQVAQHAGDMADVDMPLDVFSPEQVESLLKQGRPVFVDFTADWCITCKYNEQHVLHTPDVVAALRAHNVAVLRADWTQRDESIQRVLGRFGRAGVPMYLLYNPATPTQEPLLLPELLTQRLVLEALQKLPEAR